MYYLCSREFYARCAISRPVLSSIILYKYVWPTGGVSWLSPGSTTAAGHQKHGDVWIQRLWVHGRYDKQVDGAMRQVALKLHLARHTVGDKQLWCAGDIECRQDNTNIHMATRFFVRSVIPRLSNVMTLRHTES